MKNCQENDIPKYRKKKINTSQTKNRSDHKHDYEKIIVESFLNGWQWGNKQGKINL